ncbi:axin-like isoform X2 [Macrosteles quadrilineatus]|uniref:axin-like isoform X3 n=1 Tax=Macrosteles quadrilineatus TaxID=74068 RepID=UPI0023E0C745|nr:axin-like isoform X3 [Macrosteles quadrilineatus]XP_054289722.1 axin-like isoform X2 [Macrosteles quadrilineatus]
MSDPVTDSSTITFHQNSPRPPVVPGEETCGGVQSPAAGWGGRYGHGGSPVPTPRRSTLTHHVTLPGAAPLGFEPEGCSSPRGGTGGEDRYSPPSCLRWAQNLPSLLEDPDGVELFRRYLESEGRSHADTLLFWFACEGLRKQSDPDKISQLVRVIYRKYFLKTQLGIPEDLRLSVMRRIKAGTDLDCGVFNESQREVERIITETTYPNFLRSEIYLNHVQAMQNGSSSCSGSGSGSGSSSGGVTAAPPTMLATVHEDSELVEPPLPLPLTRDMLLATQKRRAVDLRPKPEAYAGVYLPNLGKARMAYSSYNPVSRQDSELQSLSSDARTESDNMSLTDSSVDGVSSSGHHRFSRKQYRQHCRQVKESATLNRDMHVHHTFIPRTQRIQKEQVHPMKPDQFASILIEKLENVKRNQEAQEILDRKLSEAETCSPADFSAAIQRSLSETIREKLQLEDDNVQDILDQHVSRVWSDLTPSRSPGVSSPRPKSPPHRRSAQPLNKAGCGSSLPSHVNVAPNPYQSRPYSRYPRKDKDVFSTFSSDSGNVHDFTEGSEHRMHMPKSKSMPDYNDAYSQVPGHDNRLRQSRKWSSKKTELTDSGVSVVSDTPPVSVVSQFKDSRVLSWLMESGPVTEGRSSQDSSVASLHRRRSASPPAPAQPFVADPSMPPLPSPHTATQLEEARRRLMEDESRKARVSRLGVCGSQSGGSTLRRASAGGRNVPPPPTTGTATYTTVVFSFCDEQVPYRTKIPARQVTLRQFKEYLPKKGSYRYFFKTECEDLDMKVIQEEVTDDNDVLPLWEGKIMAQVKAAD